jgi:pilus assembly protein Flp/PilA
METVKLFPIRMYLAAKALREREEGQAMVEYALILAMVSVAAITILGTLGGNVSKIFSSINADM